MPPQLRVLHITPEYPPVIWGGLGTAVGGLVTASAREGLAVAVLLVGGVLVLGEGGYGGPRSLPLHEPLDPQSIVDHAGVVFYHIAPHDAATAGVRLVRRWKPDVIHLHTAWLWPVARAIVDETDTPVVFTVHSLDRAEYEIGALPTQWEVQDQVIGAAARVIALSESERELLNLHCPFARDRVRVVGNGIADSERPPDRDHWERAGPPLVLYTGRFVDRKGIRELLAAIPVVLDQAPDARFVLIGGYGGAAEIERDWRTAELCRWGQQVEFTGWLPPAAVTEWYRAADILVVPSWYEPFGMVILEGMLHGLAIAAAGVGGPAEILQHEQTALLYPPRDACAIAASLLRLVEDRSLRRQLGSAAAEQVRSTWLWPHIVAKMRTVYLEAIQSFRQRAVREVA